MRSILQICLVFLFGALFLAPVVSGAAITASITTEGSSGSPAAALEAEGYGAIAAENWTGLLSVAGAGLSLDPGNPVFYAMEGYAERKLGNYTAALSASTTSLEIAPNAVRYANRGMVWLALGNYTAALADGQQSVALDPGYGDGQALLAMAYLGLNRTAEAQDAIGRALEISPVTPSYWHVQGRVELSAGNCTGAIASLERSIALDPDYSLPWPTMSNATEDLATARAECSADQPKSPSTGGKAPIEPVISVLAAVGGLFLARRVR